MATLKQPEEKVRGILRGLWVFGKLGKVLSDAFRRPEITLSAEEIASLQKTDRKYSEPMTSEEFRKKWLIDVFMERFDKQKSKDTRPSDPR